MKLGRSLIAFTFVGLTACGQKGPLFMPDLEKLNQESKALEHENSLQQEEIKSNAVIQQKDVAASKQLGSM